MALGLAADPNGINAPVSFPIALDPLFQPAVAANMAARRHDANATLTNIDAGRPSMAIATAMAVVVRLGAGGGNAKPREKKRGGGGNHEMFHPNVLPVFR